MVLQAREIGVGDEFPAIELHEIRVGHRVVIAVAGELDIATAATLRVAVDGVIESGVAEVWIDLSHVAFMDSTGLRVLLNARGRLREISKSFAIICPEGAVRRVFALAGLDREFAIHADRAAAHAAG